MPLSNAVAHAHFETIHPFTDYNGRTGQALLHAMLRHRVVTTHVTVLVYAGLLSNVSALHQALTEYREGDPEPMTRLTAEASRYPRMKRRYPKGTAMLPENLSATPRHK